MKRALLCLLAFASLADSTAALGQDPAAIVAARRAGLVGERYDGYLGFVTTYPSDALRRDVSAINIRRRALYSGLAARKGVSPEEVGITAACTLLRRVAVGEYYLLGQGGWRRVTAGQSPVPGYCA